MLARIDDTCAIMVDEIRAYETYKHFALRGRLCWSKNVLEERAVPAQIIFGSSNFLFLSFTHSCDICRIIVLVPCEEE